MASKGGVFFVTSTPKSVTSNTLNKWYIDEHIPDLLKTSIFNAAFRYENVTQSTFFKSDITPEKEEFLGLYPLKDLGKLSTDEFHSIPVRSEILGEGAGEKSCFEVIKFGARIYQHVDGYEGERAANHPAPAKLLITAAMSPPKSQEDDFHAWYKEEHFRTLSECKGYIRTRRYRIAEPLRPETEEVPNFLAIHEFDCKPGELDAEGLAKSGGTEWSQKIMGNLEKNETKIWAEMGAWGEIKAKF